MPDLKALDYTDKELLYNHFMQPALVSAIAALDLPKGARGLDAGCGPGGMLHLLNQAIGGEIVGIDMSDGHLAAAQQQAEKYGLADRVRLAYVDLEQPLPFPDATFDYVWTADTLSSGYEEEAFDDPVATVREFARVTKPGGVVALFFGNWLGTMLMPGYAHIEHCLTTAAEVRYRKRRRFHPSFHHENALGWLQAAGLENPRISAHFAHYQYPLPPELVYYIQRYVFEDEYIRPEGLKDYVHQVGMTEDDWKTWMSISDPDSPDYLLNRRDYFCVRFGTLSIGNVS
ncbi:MAG: class I SAM-dependent methyltransferase [Burkholderiales bacterium]|nr:class I SAM-dependent methyltransferase [Anaerolineae bacterium]